MHCWCIRKHRFFLLFCIVNSLCKSFSIALNYTRVGSIVNEPQKPLKFVCCQTCVFLPLFSRDSRQRLVNETKKKSLQPPTERLRNSQARPMTSWVLLFYEKLYFYDAEHKKKLFFFAFSKSLDDREKNIILDTSTRQRFTISLGRDAVVFAAQIWWVSWNRQ